MMLFQYLPKVIDPGNKTLNVGKVQLELTDRVCGLAGGAPGRRYCRLFTDISKLEILGCCLVMKQRSRVKEAPGSWNVAILLRIRISAGGSVAVTCCCFLDVLKHCRDFGHIYIYMYLYARGS